MGGFCAGMAFSSRDEMFFFFQAEDGIRDHCVTGVQTCALPIFEYARERGARTVAVVCVPDSELGRMAEIEIAVDTGQEVLKGSTRMKAGTAQKMVLNMLTTGAMTRMGRVYRDLMVNVQIGNRKLAERGLAILEEAAGADRLTAARALRAAGNEVPVALIMLKTGLSPAQARQRLKSTKGNVRAAIGKA